MNWEGVRRWRVRQRQELVARRHAVGRAHRRSVRISLISQIRERVTGAALPGSVIGGYWPIRGEINLTPLFRELDNAGFEIALPVVVKKNRPVEFWQWASETPMTRGYWDIPVPAERRAVVPDILVVPLVGFDDGCFRLGNGGGYYDRTLADMDQKPLCIGVGYAFSQVRTIFPQPHDVPMDVIVTEDGPIYRHVQMLANRSVFQQPVELASPACFMAESDPAYLGFMSTTECLNLVLSLLRDLRTAAGVAMEIMLFGGNALGTKAYLDLVHGDIHACTILRRASSCLITDDRYGFGAAGHVEGDESQAIDSDTDLKTLHERAAETIRCALPKISDLRIYEALTKVLRLQERALSRLVGGREAPEDREEGMRNAH